MKYDCKSVKQKGAARSGCGPRKVTLLNTHPTHELSNTRHASLVSCSLPEVSRVPEPVSRHTGEFLEGDAARLQSPSTTFAAHNVRCTQVACGHTPFLLHPVIENGGNGKNVTLNVLTTCGSHVHRVKNCEGVSRMNSETTVQTTVQSGVDTL
jgi:hypothetical protein